MRMIPTEIYSEKMFEFFFKYRLTTNAELSCVQVFKQLCDAGFLSFITDDSTDTRLDDNQMVHSDIIDHGLTNQSLFLDYIRKHIDRLALRAGNTRLDMYRDQ